MSARMSLALSSASDQRRNTWTSDSEWGRAPSLFTVLAIGATSMRMTSSLGDEPARSADKDAETVEDVARGETWTPPDDTWKSEETMPDVSPRPPQHVAVACGKVLGIEATLPLSVTPAHPRVLGTSSPGSVLKRRVRDVENLVPSLDQPKAKIVVVRR